ncbi:zinc C3HC4 type domain-containing protein [Cryptosporidium andersoni]|uniref:Zinc C3HC4 type domain-containing protein n=1 Tax=Cryptosporidium andersoni TaxID=117008 RepID=A0A1J4MEG5_9CRYT|nr:zinc C3HC4 type domain-containing protein [Cryptosporidium andersoni]
MSKLLPICGLVSSTLACNFWSISGNSDLWDVAHLALPFIIYIIIGFCINFHKICTKVFLGELKSYEIRHSRIVIADFVLSSLPYILIVSGFNVIDIACWVLWLTPFACIRVCLANIEDRVENSVAFGGINGLFIRSSSNTSPEVQTVQFTSQPASPTPIRDNISFVNKMNMYNKACRYIEILILRVRQYIRESFHKYLPLWVVSRTISGRYLTPFNIMDNRRQHNSSVSSEATLYLFLLFLMYICLSVIGHGLFFDVGYSLKLHIAYEPISLFMLWIKTLIRLPCIRSVLSNIKGNVEDWSFYIQQFVDISMNIFTLFTYLHVLIAWGTSRSFWEMIIWISLGWFKLRTAFKYVVLAYNKIHYRITIDSILRNNTMEHIDCDMITSSIHSGGESFKRNISKTNKDENNTFKFSFCDPSTYICVICRETLESSESQRLICGHVFHYQCLRRWLENDITCPICRTPGIPPAAVKKLQQLKSLEQQVSITDNLYTNILNDTPNQNYSENENDSMTQFQTARQYLSPQFISPSREEMDVNLSGESGPVTSPLKSSSLIHSELISNSLRNSRDSVSENLTNPHRLCPGNLLNADLKSSDIHNRFTDNDRSTPTQRSTYNGYNNLNSSFNEGASSHQYRRTSTLLFDMKDLLKLILHYLIVRMNTWWSTSSLSSLDENNSPDRPQAPLGGS